MSKFHNNSTNGLFSNLSTTSPLISSANITSTIWRPISPVNVTHLVNSSVDVDLLENVSMYLWIVVSPILFVVGVIGNVLTIGVLKQMKFQKKSPLFFLFVLALCDIMVLCVGLSRYWIKETFSLDIRALSDFGCKFNLFFIYWSMQLSSWVFVCVVLERCIKSNFPYRYPRIVTIPRCISLVFLLMFILAGVDMHYFWTNGLIPDGPEWECNSLTDAYGNFEEFVFTYVDFTVLSVVPSLLLIVMNATIIRVIRHSRKFRKSTIWDKRTYKKLKRLDTRLTRMLVYTSVYFLMTTLPISIYFIVDSYEKDLNDLGKAKMHVVWSTAYLFQFTNYTLKSCLYSFTNRDFRRKAMGLITCKLTKQERKSKKDLIYTVSTTETPFESEDSKSSEDLEESIVIISDKL